MRNVVPKEGPRAPLFFAVITILLSANLTNAQTVDVATLEVCAALETEALKLACFEAIISTGRTAVSEVAPTGAASPTSAVVPKVTNVSKVPAKIEATSQTAGSMAAPPVSAVPSAVEAATDDAKPSLATDAIAASTERSVADELGREQLAKHDKEEQDEAVKATVVDVTQGYNNDLRFHLANGQIWRQIEPRHLQYPKNRDFEIEISQGMLGEYRLRIGKNGRLVRIRRTQ